MTEFNQSVRDGKEVEITHYDDSSSGTVTALATTGKSNIRLNSATTLPGIANGVADKFLTLTNINTVPLTVQNNNTGASSGNRILTGTGGDVTIGVNA